MCEGFNLLKELLNMCLLCSLSVLELFLLLKGSLEVEVVVDV